MATNNNPASSSPSSTSSSYLSRENLSETEKILLEPFTYLTTHPGKEIRTKLIEAFNHWLKVPEGELDTIRNVVEMLHTASLLIDDVEDDSSLRRGIPVAHKIYGTPLTINCANYVYFLALKEAQKLGKLGSQQANANQAEVVSIFTDELIQLHRGQGMEIHWRDSGTCPSEEEYLEMVGNKTGGLLRLAVKLMQISSPTQQEDYIPLVNLLGIHFQIRDDYINLNSNEYSKNKGFAEDINILKQRTFDTDVKSYAIDLMRQTGSFAYTRSRLLELEKKARTEIERLGGNPVLVGVLDYLERDYREEK
ncbi:Geranylgeranyl pyrophosphate synthase [Quaeritorhiza haematococci]|nr:Geranylgeranyl pyrophosphate synthase [Quaeritorhiza haematococci]